MNDAATVEPATVDGAALVTLFRSARTHTVWDGRDVTDADLHAAFELMKWAPTSANSSPARFLFLRSKEAKEKLRPALSAGNLDKTMAAPVVTVVAYDPKFYDQLPKLFPHADARSWFAGNAALAEETAFRNGSMQGAYFVLAARAVGLDCGPMSGFDRGRVDAAFFEESGWKSNFLVNLGHGMLQAVQPRSPRFRFDEACRIV